MNILSLTYLGNVQWFAKLLEGAVIDVGEHYVKQSWRNRCEIAAADGRLSLTVNVAAGAQRLPVREVRVDYSKRWQHRHIEALRSAYGRAPFFEHYWPALEGVLRRGHTFLYDLDRELLQTVIGMMKSDVKLTFSESYIEHAEDDFRNSISPKRPAEDFRPEPYWQVFGGWEPNLSVVDVLMCEGPAAAEIIRMSARDL
jgi:hypothetical protein